MRGKRRNILTTVILGLALLLAAACGEIGNTAYSQFYDIPKEGWMPTDVLVFEPATTDSAADFSVPVDVELVLRSSLRGAVRPLPLCVTVEEGDRQLSNDTLVIRPDAGGNVRRKEYPGVRETRVALRSGVRVTDGYSVSLSPLRETDEPEGLLTVGLVMTKSGQEPEKSQP